MSRGARGGVIMGKQFEEQDIVTPEEQEITGEEFVGDHYGEKPTDKTTHVAHLAEDSLEHLSEEVSKDEDVVVVVESSLEPQSHAAAHDVDGPLDEEDFHAHEVFEKVDSEEE